MPRKAVAPPANDSVPTREPVAAADGGAQPACRSSRLAGWDNRNLLVTNERRVMSVSDLCLDMTCVPQNRDLPVDHDDTTRSELLVALHIQVAMPYREILLWTDVRCYGITIALVSFVVRDWWKDRVAMRTTYEPADR